MDADQPIQFVGFPKIHRLSRECYITEKIDGTNAQVFISDDGLEIHAGSRTKWLTPEKDNYGFARWVEEHKADLFTLGSGRHFGEWWGQGINRGYGLKEKRFSLFNVKRWSEQRPECCHVIPVLYYGIFNTSEVFRQLYLLQEGGSVASPGFMNPEGVVIYHVQGNVAFKKTIQNDEQPKGVGEP